MSNEEENIPSGHVYVLHHEDQCPQLIQLLLSQIQSNGPVICLGPRATSLGSDQPVLTSSEYLMRLLRQHNVHRNEREMLLSAEDQIIAVQLCLAELNKQLTGEFDVEVSKVLEYNQKLQKTKLPSDRIPDLNISLTNLDSSFTSKLNSSVCGSEVDFDSFLDQYKNFLKSNNHLDVMDLLEKLKSEASENEALQQEIRKQSFLLLEPPSGPTEKSIFSFLVQDKEVSWMKVAESLLPSSECEEKTYSSEQILFENTTMNDILNSQAHTTNTHCDKRISVTEHHVEKLFLGYLHLLVNSRSEIALARVINTPERELDHKAFTHLKHHAKGKAVSMFQMATSYIMKLRLGGRGYQPDPTNKLANHVKGLGDFVDLTHRLQTVVEEDLDHRSAITRVLNVIKNTIVKCRDNRIRRETVDAVRDKLLREVSWVIDDMEKVSRDSPKRSVSAGGSLVGHRALRVLRWILDHAASQPPVISTLDTLTDVISSQRTPLKFPSVMSQFRSPLEASPDSRQNRSLAQRMRDRYPIKKAARLPQQQCYDWARPLHDNGFSGNDDIITVDDYVPCKTVIHPATKSTEDSSSQTTRVLESIMDQENTDSGMHTSSKQCQNLISKTSGKRPLDTDTHKEAKRPRVQGSQLSQAPAKSKSKVSKKKIVPLQKGQKTLGAFFRM